MTKQEKREVLEYVQARVVVCLDHGKELLELVLAKWDGLSLDQKQEAAAYIIPEVINTSTVICNRYSQQVTIFQYSFKIKFFIKVYFIQFKMKYLIHL